MIKTAACMVGCVAILVACSGSSGSSGGGGGGPTIDPGPGAPISGVFGGERIDFPNSPLAAYIVSKDQTFVTAYAGNATATPADGASIDLRFRGKTTGTFSCGDEPDGGLTIDMTFTKSTSNTTATYSTTSTPDLTPCTITVTEYGDVGGRVKGTFVGKFVATERSASAGASLPAQSIQATSGIFDAVRSPDTP